MGSAEAHLAELTRTCAEQRGTIEALTAAAEQREISARAEFRQATRELSQLALVARHMDSAVVIADADGLLEWVNAAFTRMSGYSEAEALGKTGRSLLSTDQTLPPIEELTR